jgi:large subunit ribosomal protein L29
MSFSKIKEVSILSDEELSKEILLGKKQLFDLRLKQGSRQAFKSHSFRHIKHRLGQLLMVQSQRISTNAKKD